jgi:hypothetical protein
VSPSPLAERALAIREKAPGAIRFGLELRPNRPPLLSYAASDVIVFDQKFF